MIFEQEPENFQSEFDLATCFIEHEGEILLLLRQPWETDGSTWGLPAAMVDPGETPMQAVIREIKEEASIDLPVEALQFVKKVFVRKPDREFVMHCFYINFLERPEAKANPDEHSDFKWIKPQDAPSLPLISDGLQTIELFLKWKSET